MKPITQSYYHKLIDEINHHNRLYYIECKPIIPDYEYDLLLKELEGIEKEHPDWIIPTSPTQRVGEMISGGFQQIVHEVPMLSLANTYSREEVEDFVERVHKLTEGKRVAFAAELKMDGIAVTLRFEKGVFIRAVTRGDGRKGDEITSNMRTIATCPLQLYGKDIPELLEVRGEVFMPKKAFLALNKEKEEAGEELWANPRNAAAGSLKLLDPRIAYQRKLGIVCYGLAQQEPAIAQSQFAIHKTLKGLGLPTFPDDYVALCHSIDDIFAFIDRVHHIRHDLPFEIDGIVIKVDDLKLWSHLGTTAKTPRYATAYKFAPERAETQILDITVQVGRTGVLTPVAELQPVRLAGSTIARATLHNEDEVKRKDIRIGDHVLIEKGGDVIPKVVSVDLAHRAPHSHPWHMPHKCPSCGHPVARHEGEVAVRCPNQEGCPAQGLRRIIFFASKPAMDIENLGHKIIIKLSEKGLIKRIPDIYRLKEEDLEGMEGFKEKSIHNLLEAIETSKEVSLARFILSLGIPFVGAGTADVLADFAGSIEKLMQATAGELIELEGVGEKVAASVVDYFQDEGNCDEVHELLELGVKPKAAQKKRISGHEFAGKTFVLTGTLENLTRNQAEELIKERGGKVSGSVSKKTDFVLVGSEPGSKYDKARELGIAILNEGEFLARVQY